MQLAADSDNNDERILVLRAAHQHSSQPQHLPEKANSLQELLNLQSLHSDVAIMPAFFTSIQSEIDRLLKGAKKEATKQYTRASRMFSWLTPSKIYDCFEVAVSDHDNPRYEYCNSFLCSLYI